MTPTTAIAERFWRKVDFGSAAAGSACLEWTGARVKGYGVIGGRTRGKWVYSHRLSWELHYGEIPKGLSVCHRCDNPGCVRPEHLFLGTHKDNADDRERKGRGKHVGLAGERNPNAKLTQAQVNEIRATARPGQYRWGLEKMCRKYGVTNSLIYCILKGRNWKVRP